MICEAVTKKRLLRINKKSCTGNFTGVDTYWKDFSSIVLPELTKDFRITGENSVVDSILAFHSLQTPLYKVEDKDTIIYQVLHNDLKLHHKNYINTYSNHRFVTHYSKFWEWMGNNGLKSFFIPMSVDTEILPYKEKRNDKVIFFTNIYKEKIATKGMLVAEGIKFDIMSQGRLNGTGNYTHNEAIEIVSNYEFGIGVGRSAIEMLSMGLKVVIAGKTYGGPIKEINDIEQHWKTNFNSTYYNGSGSIKDDFKGLLRMDKRSIFIFDMRKYLYLYKKFLEV